MFKRALFSPSLEPSVAGQVWYGGYLSGKYFWTRVEGKSVRLSTGDPVKFKDADFSRLRFGGRFAYAVNEMVSPYIGAAYGHEFDGKG